jgi:hypothetical protein
LGGFRRLRAGEQGRSLPPPTTLQTFQIHIAIHRSWADSINDSDRVGFNFNPLRDGTDDCPSRVPIGLFQAIAHLVGEFLQTAHH